MMATIHFSKDHAPIIPVHLLQQIPKNTALRTLAVSQSSKQLLHSTPTHSSAPMHVISEKTQDPTPTLLTLLHAAIASVQTYPESAIELQQAGNVEIGFVLYPNGRIGNINVIQSSGFSVLDTEAIRAITVVDVTRIAPRYLQAPRYFQIIIQFVLGNN